MAETTKHQTTGLENTTFDILIALGKEAQFLYSTIDQTQKKLIDLTWSICGTL